MAFMKPRGAQASLTVDFVQYTVENGVLELPDPYIEIASSHGFDRISETEAESIQDSNRPRKADPEPKKVIEEAPEQVSSIELARAKAKRSKAG